MTDSDSEQPKRDAQAEDKRQRRIVISIALTDVVWFFLDVWFIWPQSHVAALWVLFVFIALQVALAFPTESARYRYGAALAVLLLAALIQPLLPPVPPVETEGHGWLIPADDPTPPNGCSNQGMNVSNDELLMLMGTAAVHTSRKDKFVVLQLGSCPLLKMQRGPDNGIAFDADVFNEDGKLIARIENNEFYLSSGKYSYAKRPDRSTLSVYDEEGKEVLWVRYLNPNTVRMRGIFRCRGKSPLVVTDDRVISSNMSEGNSCSAVGPMSIKAFVFF